jgi:hypothetical protein
MSLDRLCNERHCIIKRKLDENLTIGIKGNQKKTESDKRNYEEGNRRMGRGQRPERWSVVNT